MPPPLPDRYELQVRLGRDGDVEEWLASDGILDRPVMIRILGPDSSPGRRVAFLHAVSAAAAINHPHLASVFNAGEVPDGVYAVSEWTGGMSLRDRLDSDETFEVGEFLPNAAGLSAALAALHEAGRVHGAIDSKSIQYAVAHPAKLASFGRPSIYSSREDDVRALARTLEHALTGGPVGGPPPSEIVDGLDPQVDRVLRDAQKGLLTARQLADGLTSAPSPAPPSAPAPAWSRRLLLVAVGLVLAAAGLVALGRMLVEGSGEPIIVPPPAAGGTTTTSTLPAEPAGPIVVVAVRSIDPFGGGDENDDLVGNLIDDDAGTAWRTERYRDPLPLLKPGVGVAFEVRGSPASVELVRMTAGVAYQLAWSPVQPDDPAAWEPIVTGRTAEGNTTLQLPPRPGGNWLLWLTDLPGEEGSDYSAEVAEVRFRQ